MTPPARRICSVRRRRHPGVADGSHYERRTSNPSLELIQRLSDALGVTAAELLSAEQRKPKKNRERPGPPSQLERVVERVRGLPRGEQQRIIDMLDDAVARAERRIAG